MATLQRIRKRSILLLIVVGLAMLAFILGDALTSSNSLVQQAQQNIISINGKKIDYKEYESRINEFEEIYKMQTNRSNLDEEIVHQIRETVYETLVREALLDEQAAALGVAVSSEEIFDMVSGENVSYMVQQMPFFQNPETGQFDRTLVLNFLRTIQMDDLSMYPADAQAQIQQMKDYWLFWENNLKYSRLEEKINNLLGKAVSANSIDARAAFEAGQRSVDFVYAYKPYVSLPDSAFQVSKSEAKARYKAQKEQYRQNIYRSARYVVVDVLPSQEDNDKVKADIDKIADEFSKTSDLSVFVRSNSDVPYVDCFVANSAYEGSASDFVNAAAVGEVKGPFEEDNAWVMYRMVAKTTAPDSVKVSQIFIRDSKEAGQHLADSLMNVLKSKKAGFADLAARYSEDQTAQNGGDMGWFREMDAIAGMGAEFTEACFKAKKGQYSLVKSNYGLHIISLTDATKPVAKCKLAQIVMNVTPSSRTYSANYSQLNQLLAGNQTADGFVQAAQKAGYQVLTAPTVRESDYTVGNVPGMRQAVRFIYNNKVGEVSQIFENSQNQFMVVAITAANDQEYRPFESVKDQLAREIRNEHKAKAIIADLKPADDIVTLAEENGMRADTVNLLSFSTRRISGLGDEPELLSAVMAAPLGEISQPVAGKNGVYVFSVISQVTSPAEFDVETEKQVWNANETYRLMYQTYEAVKDAAEIEDSRIRFY